MPNTICTFTQKQKKNLLFIYNDTMSMFEGLKKYNKRLKIQSWPATAQKYQTKQKQKKIQSHKKKSQIYLLKVLYIT